DVVLARTHQGKLDLILDVFNMKRAAARLTAHQCAHHSLGETGHQLAHTCRSRAGSAIHGDESLGHGHRDLGGLEGHHGAIAANHFVLSVTRIALRIVGLDTSRGRRRIDCSFHPRLHDSLPYSLNDAHARRAQSATCLRCSPGAALHDYHILWWRMCSRATSMRRPLYIVFADVTMY